MIPWAYSSPYSIGSSVAAQLTLTTDRQTDGPRDVLLMQKDGGLLLAHHVCVNKHEKEITVTSDQNTNVCLNSTCFAIYFQKISRHDWRVVCMGSLHPQIRQCPSHWKGVPLPLRNNRPHSIRPNSERQVFGPTESVQDRFIRCSTADARNGPIDRRTKLHATCALA